MRRCLTMFVLVLAWALTPLPCPAADEPANPVLVIFDLANAESDGQLGHTAGVKLRAKANREGKFVLVEPIDVEAAGFQPGPEAEPKDVLALVAKQFGADLAVWGGIERNADGSLTLQVRAYRLEGEEAKAVLDQPFAAADRFHLSQTTDQIVALLGDRPAPAPVDAAQMELNWRMRRNLVTNGSFELGMDAPSHWQPLEAGMSWVKEPGHGRVLKFDIPQLIAETYGFDFYSDFIDVDEPATYRFSVDYRSPGPAVIFFIKGYALLPPSEGESEAQWREVYRYQRKAGAPAEWTTLTFDFHPTMKQHSTRKDQAQYHIQKIKVDLYAYYPPGEAFFDNVVIKKVFP